MTSSDVRSRRVALVHESIVNAHVGNARPGGVRVIFAALAELGFGLVALPPAGLPAAASAMAVELALDQIADYAASGYRTVWVRGGDDPHDAALAERVAAECRRRSLALAAFAVGPADLAEPAAVVEMLRATASYS
jgi:hypothetical protein